MHFKCPKCGGWAFGTIGERRYCHSWEDGTASSNEFCYDEPGHLASMKRTLGFKLCRWSGSDEEAFTGSPEWQEEAFRKRMELREILAAQDKAPPHSGG